MPDMIVDANMYLSRTGEIFRKDSEKDRIKISIAGSSAIHTQNSFAKAKAKAKAKASAKAKSRGVVPSAEGEFDDSVLSTWIEIRRLHLPYMSEVESYPLLPFEKLKIDLPPGPEKTRCEIRELHAKQIKLRGDRMRQQEIIDQMFADNVTEVLRPLGIENLGGYENTELLISSVLQLAERVGYVYKRRFLRARPSQAAPELRPFIGDPPHEAYPSNHAFQMFSIAEVMTRMLPENPATSELFYVAQRVGENREYAGVHYASDTEAGRQLAKYFAPYMINACSHQMRAALAEWL